jgi:hypothetical protein
MNMRSARDREARRGLELRNASRAFGLAHAQQSALRRGSSGAHHLESSSGEFMMTRCAKLLAAALLAASAPWLAGSAAAEPITADRLTQGDTATRTELVQWGGGYGGGWYGPDSSAGVTVAPRSYYGYGRSAYDDYAYDRGAVAPRASSNADAVASCQQRFRSYDPASGTYLGYDGLRHPCP